MADSKDFSETIMSLFTDSLIKLTNVIPNKKLEVSSRSSSPVSLVPTRIPLNDDKSVHGISIEIHLNIH